VAKNGGLPLTLTVTLTTGQQVSTTVLPVIKSILTFVFGLCSYQNCLIAGALPHSRLGTRITPSMGEFFGSADCQRIYITWKATDMDWHWYLQCCRARILLFGNC